jgi:hypothetical protein
VGVQIMFKALDLPIKPDMQTLGCSWFPSGRHKHEVGQELTQFLQLVCKAEVLWHCGQVAACKLGAADVELEHAACV